MMGRPSPALPLLLACLACCLREVTRAATNDGAPRARDADDLDVIDVFDMAMEMRRLDHSRHDPGPELDGNFGGKFGGNGDTWLDDPSLTPTSRRKLQYSPDEIALGLQNSDYIEDVQDNPKPQRTVPVIASIGKILDDIDSKRARTQSRTAVGTTDGTTGGTTDGTTGGTTDGTTGGTTGGTTDGTTGGTTGGTTDGTTDHDFPRVFMRGGLFPQDTKKATLSTAQRPTDTTPPTATTDTPPVTDSSGFGATDTAPTTATVTVTSTETTTTTATETLLVTTTATEVSTATRTFSVTTTYTETETLTSTVTVSTVTPSTVTPSTVTPSTMPGEVDAPIVDTPSADHNKGPAITPVQPVPPSGWLYGSLVFAGLGLVLMVAGSVWLIITFVRKATLNGRRRGLV